MGQYTEGQRLHGSDGNIYVVHGGVPVLEQGALQSPKAPYEGPQAAATLQRTQQEIQQAQATAASSAAKAQAEAQSAALKAKTDQEAYDSAHPKGTGSTVYGPDYLKTLSGPDAELVKALSDGRLAFPGGFALKAPWWQQKLEQVAQYDPSFDATNFNNRAKARAALLTGKLGASSNALNTAVGHVGHLAEQISGTASHSFTPFNLVENTLSKTFGSAGVTNFQDTANKLADELESVYRNGGGAEAGVTRQLRSLDPNASLQQKQGIIANALELLASKQAANLYQYNIGSGGKPPVDLLDPAARKVLDQYPDIRDKYFGDPTQPISHDAAALISTHGGTPPPPSGGTGGAAGGTGGTPGNTPGGGGTPWDSPSPDARGIPTGGSRTIAHPEINSMVSSMVNAGAGLAAVNTALTNKNAAPLTAGQWMQVQKWKQANPGKQFPSSQVDATETKPLTLLQKAAASPGGAFAANFANSATAGIPAYLAGDQGQGAIDAMNAVHPNAAPLGSLFGGVVGAAGGEAAVAARAPAYMAKWAPRIADSMYGGVSGYTGSGGDPATAAEGAVLAPLAGKVGEKVMGGIGSAAKGVTDPAVQYLRGLNIPLTVGQTVGRGGLFGRGLKKIEDGMTALPGVGNMVDARRTEGLQGLQKAAFDIGSETTGDQVQNTGAAGLRDLQGLVGQTYSRHLDPVTLDIAGSPTALNDITNAQMAAHSIPKVGQDAADALSYHIGEGVDPQGMMSGRDYQEAYRGLGRAGRKAAPGDYGHEFGQATRMGQDALSSALENQNPGAYQGFLDANAAHRRMNILADALGSAKNQEDGMFTGAQLNAADFRNASNLTGKVAAASGNRPFGQLAEAAQAVLPSKLPDSGTSTRALIMRGVAGAGLFGGGTGLGYAHGDAGSGAEAGLGTLATLALFGSRPGQKMLVKALADRPDWLRAIGSGIQNHAAIGGTLGTGYATYKLAGQ